jgi:hypothetical protein
MAHRISTGFGRQGGHGRRLILACALVLAGEWAFLPLAYAAAASEGFEVPKQDALPGFEPVQIGPAPTDPAAKPQKPSAHPRALRPTMRQREG